MTVTHTTRTIQYDSVQEMVTHIDQMEHGNWCVRQIIAQTDSKDRMLLIVVFEMEMVTT